MSTDVPSQRELQAQLNGALINWQYAIAAALKENRYLKAAAGPRSSTRISDCTLLPFHWPSMQLSSSCHSATLQHPRKQQCPDFTSTAMTTPCNAHAMLPSRRTSYKISPRIDDSSTCNHDMLRATPVLHCYTTRRQKTDHLQGLRPN